MYEGYTPQEIDDMDLADIQLFFTLLPRMRQRELDMLTLAVNKAFVGDK